jgi:hypothetical protein
MKKLYAYVDETGQETAGAFFLVAVVVAGENRDALIEWLSSIEQATGKGKTPWHKSRHQARQAYMDRVLNDARLGGSIFYSVYPGTRSYHDLTLLTIAKALGERSAGQPYKVTVIIDGLQRSEIRLVSVGLRRIRVPIRKVRGARDESHALVRLADAMAGFLRDAEEGQAEWQARLLRAQMQGIIRKV